MSALTTSGAHLDIVEHGDPDGIPVVLLHGLSDSRHSWDLALAHFPQSVRAIAVSQRGHGDSARPEGYRVRDFSADVLALLDARGIERAVIAGHSMGSTIARRFAADHPDRVRGLVLIGSFATFAGKPEVAELAAIAAELSDPIDRDFVREFQASTLAGPISPAFLETIIDESCKVPVTVFQAAIAGLIQDDVSRDLGRVDAPVLIVWGDQDAYCPRADQDALARALAGARLSVFAGSGHAPHWSIPSASRAISARSSRDSRNSSRRSRVERAHRSTRGARLARRLAHCGGHAGSRSPTVCATRRCGLARRPARRARASRGRLPLGARAARSRPRALRTGAHPGGGLHGSCHDLSGPGFDGPNGRGRHPLPSPDAFAAAARRAGITRNGTVVAYDQDMSGGAARLWWLLRHIGKREVAVLDGGLAGWPGELEAGAPAIRRATSKRSRRRATTWPTTTRSWPRPRAVGRWSSTRARPSASVASTSRSIPSPATSQGHAARRARSRSRTGSWTTRARSSPTAARASRPA